MLVVPRPDPNVGLVDNSAAGARPPSQLAGGFGDWWPPGRCPDPGHVTIGDYHFGRAGSGFAPSHGRQLEFLTGPARDLRGDLASLGFSRWLGATGR